MTTAAVTDFSWRATTREIDDPNDILDYLGPDGFTWIKNGFGFVTAGRITRVEPENALAVLSQIAHDDLTELVGSGPLVVGALPFAADEPAELFVPARIVGRNANGRAWMTEIEEAPSWPANKLNRPTTFSVTGGTPKPLWDKAVTAALARVEEGAIEKVVLARSIEITADQAFSVTDILSRLRRDQPGCFVYSTGGFLGASPELLVRRTGTTVTSSPMAGTVAGTSSAAIERLRTSAKDGREHDLVVEAILAGLAPYCKNLDAVMTPEVAVLATISHLVTPIRGQLNDPPCDVLALTRALHPTPAVGGTPTDAAIALIAQLEDSSRGFYAGPVGWVDAKGDGEFALALRGALIDGTRATMHAGAGIVAGSNPETEWRETEAKFAPMIAALTNL